MYHSPNNINLGGQKIDHCNDTKALSVIDESKKTILKTILKTIKILNHEKQHVYQTLGNSAFFAHWL